MHDSFCTGLFPVFDGDNYWLPECYLSYGVRFVIVRCVRRRVAPGRRDLRQYVRNKDTYIRGNLR